MAHTCTHPTRTRMPSTLISQQQKPQGLSCTCPNSCSKEQPLPTGHVHARSLVPGSCRAQALPCSTPLGSTRMVDKPPPAFLGVTHTLTLPSNRAHRDDLLLGLLGKHAGLPRVLRAVLRRDKCCLHYSRPLPGPPPRPSSRPSSRRDPAISLTEHGSQGDLRMAGLSSWHPEGHTTLPPSPPGLCLQPPL